VRWNAAARTRASDDDEPAPDRNDEYFLYQTLVGAFPFYEGERPAFRERLAAYLVKAVREAKTHTAWLEPDEAYERAFLQFAERILTPGDDNRFLPDFLAFQGKIAWYGVWNSLAQTIWKVAAPGVPDFYRGTELWDLSLVDPDNRRPVDWPRRRRILAYLDERAATGVLSLLEELYATLADGRIKLFVTARALRARKAHAALFTDGDLRPLQATGAQAESVVAFARVRAGNGAATWALAAAPRFLTRVAPEGQRPTGDVWTDTAVALPEDAPRRWKDTLTGQPLEAGPSGLPLKDLWRHLPGALLVSEG
jgi:(1->4)-alpha-D-glucan 1-alpha-D-glucosylmutase